MRSGALLLTICLAAANCFASQISSFTTTSFGPYQYPSSSFDIVFFVLLPNIFVVDDGTSWDAGAGNSANSGLSVINISTFGNTVQYTLSQVSFDLVQFGSFDSGTHSTSGSFGAAGPLILQATIGSN